MGKTLHKKLTENYRFDHTAALVYADSNDSLTGLATEMAILNNAAHDLLQPRPEAIARLLKMARDL